MFNIEYATEKNENEYFKIEPYLSKSEFDKKIRDNRCYIIKDEDETIGVLRYNLFWDYIPFLTLIKISEPYQRKGFGKFAMQFWENEMKKSGHKILMTSTQVDEQAQHFYRKLGYKDIGSIVFENQALEMFMIKNI